MANSNNKDGGSCTRRIARVLLPLRFRTYLKDKKRRREALRRQKQPEVEIARWKRHIRFLKFVFHGRPVPLSYWRSVRKVVSIFANELESPFRTPTELKGSTGDALVSPEIKSLLVNEVLGTWAMSAETIDFIWNELTRIRPSTIFEFGSGNSTIVLAKYASLERSKPDGKRPLVVSVEQSKEVAEQIKDKLRRLGIGNGVEIVHAPLDDGFTYKIDAEEMISKLHGQKIDFILIDGPAGPDGCRTQTLPLVLNYCAEHAKWYLDDAYRDSEQSSMAEWRKRDIPVDGVLLLGSGLGTGHISPKSG